MKTMKREGLIIWVSSINRHKYMIFLSMVLVVAVLSWGAGQGHAQLRSVTQAQREAAAARAAARC